MTPGTQGDWTTAPLIALDLEGSGAQDRGVFVGFTLSQAGMVRHWRSARNPGWAGRAGINGLGALLTLAALAVELISKFTEGAWLVVLVVPLLVLMFARIRSTYTTISAASCSTGPSRRARSTSSSADCTSSGRSGARR